MGARVEVSEDVDEASVEDLVEAGAFFVGEAGAAAVGVWASDVDFLVGDVEVAGEEDGFAFFEGLDVGEEGGVPLEAVGEAGEFGLGVGGVDGDDEAGGEFSGDDAAFVVVGGDADASRDGERLGFGEDGGAAVAWFGGRVPCEVPAGEP